jgi:hypothetical protein
MAQSVEARLTIYGLPAPAWIVEGPPFVHR